MRILVGYFPNVTTLQLDSLYVRPDERPDERRVPQLSQPLRGKIHLDCFGDDCVEFFDQLAKLNPEYEKLVLVSRFHVGSRLIESLFWLSASTVKYLRLTAELEREYPHETSALLTKVTNAWNDVSKFSRVRRVRVSRNAEKQVWNFLSSMCSIEMLAN